MEKAVVTRFYRVRSTEHRSVWARIWITDDGCLSILSDHGNYGYWWGSPGCEFRQFLCTVDTGYLMGKLSEGKREVDRDATFAAVKREIMSCRRSRYITRDQARAEWDLAREVDWDDEFVRADWYYNHTKLHEQMMEVIVRRFPMQLQMFVKWLWPVFVEELKKELRSEAYDRLSKMDAAP